MPFASDGVRLARRARPPADDTRRQSGRPRHRQHPHDQSSDLYRQRKDRRGQSAGIEAKAEAVILDVELSPNQLRNLEKIIQTDPRSSGRDHRDFFAPRANQRVQDPSRVGAAAISFCRDSLISGLTSSASAAGASETAGWAKSRSKSTVVSSKNASPFCATAWTRSKKNETFNAPGARTS